MYTKEYKRFNCILENNLQNVEISIFATNIISDNDTFTFYDTHEIVAILPKNKTFITKIEKIEEDLGF